MVDQEPRQQQVGDGADARAGDQQPDSRRDALRIDVLADERDRERRHASAQALDHAAGDQRADPPRERAYQRSEYEHVQRGQQHTAATQRMYVSRGTVKAHLGHVYKKLGVSNRVELVTARAALRAGP